MLWQQTEQYIYKIMAWKLIFHRHRSEIIQAPHLPYSQLVNESTLYSNLCVHTKYILMDQKITLVSISRHSAFTDVDLLFGSASHSSTLVAFTTLMPQKDENEANNNIWSRRHINISRLETNCSWGLPDASKQRNALDETRQGLCLKKCLMLDYTV